jgi:hypothetical protein
MGAMNVFHAWIKTKYLKIGYCDTWFFGYQITETLLVKPKYDILILIVPGLAILISI